QVSSWLPENTNLQNPRLERWVFGRAIAFPGVPSPPEKPQPTKDSKTMKSRSIFSLMIFLAALLAACAPAGPASGAPQETLHPTPGAALQADAAQYASRYGISLDEALSRASLQDEIGQLNAALQQKEAATFAGLWIQNEPEYRVVVAFTRDGKRTIRPYLNGKSWADLVEFKTFPYSLKQLQAAQEQAGQMAQALGISITSYINVKTNRVTLVVGNPGLFLDEIRAAGQALPEPVDVVAIDPDHLSGTLRGSVETYPGPDGRTIYFPMQPPTNVYLTALMEGTLVLDSNGCLRVETPGGVSPLVLWHHDFELRVEGEQIDVLDGEGRVVGRVGEAIRMGGGEAPAVSIPGLPREACPGPYWELGQIESR
ncbi:MAG TPA: hypothetical protein VE082_01060, partial [Desulfobaccales bacterium]|nr:hypothetical protein [Desulfobaccales bacterium]